MYYLHESRCHFQFMRRLSILSAGPAGVGEPAPHNPLKNASQTGYRFNNETQLNSISCPA